MTRQPVHTVYVAADRLAADTVERWGAEALRLVDARGADWPPLSPVRDRVVAKLRREPVEDLRVDFEDGYGARPDAEEDADAARAGAALAAGPAPPFCGVRVKPDLARALRTVERFLGGLGPVPEGFVVTLAKAGPAAAVGAFADAFDALESRLGLPPGTLRVELQIETARAVVAADGSVALPGLVAAARGRCTGAPFGPYDYTAELGLDPSEQRLDHPACDHARRLMQVALAGTGVRISDGGLNRVPTADDQVMAVWDRHHALVTRALREGFWQGWDMHPSHLPSRFAAVFGFLLADLDAVRSRLARTQAGVVDEPATLAALRRRVQRARDCGAFYAGEDPFA